MGKTRLNKALESIEVYKNHSKETDVMFLGARCCVDEIDLKQLKKEISYKECKELYKKLYLYMKDVKKAKFEILLRELKEEEYPEILGVHYYPEIKPLDLEEETKVEIDRLLRRCYKKHYRKVDIEFESFGLEEAVIEQLIEKKIIEKLYIFRCNCGGDDCYDKIVTQEYLDGIKEYWSKEETTENEDEKFNYGYINTGCWNSEEVEIGNLEDFNKNVRRISYKVTMHPDLRLEEI